MRILIIIYFIILMGKLINIREIPLFEKILISKKWVKRKRCLVQARFSFEVRKMII